MEDGGGRRTFAAPTTAPLAASEEALSISSALFVGLRGILCQIKLKIDPIDGDAREEFDLNKHLRTILGTWV